MRRSEKAKPQSPLCMRENFPRNAATAQWNPGCPEAVRAHSRRPPDGTKAPEGVPQGSARWNTAIPVRSCRPPHAYRFVRQQNRYQAP